MQPSRRAALNQIHHILHVRENLRIQVLLTERPKRDLLNLATTPAIIRPAKQLDTGDSLPEIRVLPTPLLIRRQRPTSLLKSLGNRVTSSIRLNEILFRLGF
jgi:hypothetical protein